MVAASPETDMTGDPAYAHYIEKVVKRRSAQEAKPSERGTMTPQNSVERALADAQLALYQLYPQGGDAVTMHRAEGLQAQLDELARKAQEMKEASENAKLLVIETDIRAFIEGLDLPNALAEMAA